MKCVLVTQRVGERKVFYNLRSSQKCCSLVYPFKITLYSNTRRSHAIGKQHNVAVPEQSVADLFPTVQTRYHLVIIPSLIPPSKLFSEREFVKARSRKISIESFGKDQVIGGTCSRRYYTRRPSDQSVRAKGQDADTLQAKFDEIIYATEVKLLDGTIDNLCSNVKDLKAAIDPLARKIDGTIAKWKSNLQKLKEITSDQVDSLVDSAMKFASTISPKSAVARASKALQENRRRIKHKKLRKRVRLLSCLSNLFMKSSVRRLTVQRKHQPLTIVLEIDEKFLSHCPGRENGSENHKQRPHRRNKCNSPHRRSKQAKHPQK